MRHAGKWHQISTVFYLRKLGGDVSRRTGCTLPDDPHGAPDALAKPQQTPWAPDLRRARIAVGALAVVAAFERRRASEGVAMQMTGPKTRSVFERYNITSAGDLRDAARLVDAVASVATTAKS
jgi:hypothetical protein